jgi:hypothetical protein
VADDAPRVDAKPYNTDVFLKLSLGAIIFSGNTLMTRAARCWFLLAIMERMYGNKLTLKASCTQMGVLLNVNPGTISRAFKDCKEKGFFNPVLSKCGNYFDIHDLKDPFDTYLHPFRAVSGKQIWFINGSVLEKAMRAFPGQEFHELSRKECEQVFEAVAKAEGMDVEAFRSTKLGKMLMKENKRKDRTARAQGAERMASEENTYAVGIHGTDVRFLDLPKSEKSEVMKMEQEFYLAQRAVIESCLDTGAIPEGLQSFDRDVAAAQVSRERIKNGQRKPPKLMGGLKLAPSLSESQEKQSKQETEATMPRFKELPSIDADEGDLEEMFDSADLGSGAVSDGKDKLVKSEEMPISSDSEFSADLLEPLQICKPREDLLSPNGERMDRFFSNAAAAPIGNVKLRPSALEGSGFQEQEENGEGLGEGASVTGQKCPATGSKNFERAAHPEEFTTEGEPALEKMQEQRSEAEAQGEGEPPGSARPPAPSVRTPALRLVGRAEKKAARTVKAHPGGQDEQDESEGASEPLIGDSECREVLQTEPNADSDDRGLDFRIAHQNLEKWGDEFFLEGFSHWFEKYEDEWRVNPDFFVGNTPSAYERFGQPSGWFDPVRFEDASEGIIPELLGFPYKSKFTQDLLASLNEPLLQAQSRIHLERALALGITSHLGRFSAEVVEGKKRPYLRVSRHFGVFLHPLNMPEEMQHEIAKSADVYMSCLEGANQIFIAGVRSRELGDTLMTMRQSEFFRSVLNRGLWAEFSMCVYGYPPSKSKPLLEHIAKHWALKMSEEEVKSLLVDPPDRGVFLRAHMPQESLAHKDLWPVWMTRELERSPEEGAKKRGAAFKASKVKAQRTDVGVSKRMFDAEARFRLRSGSDTQIRWHPKMERSYPNIVAFYDSPEAAVEAMDVMFAHWPRLKDRAFPYVEPTFEALNRVPLRQAIAGLIEKQRQDELKAKALAESAGRQASAPAVQAAKVAYETKQEARKAAPPVSPEAAKLKTRKANSILWDPTLAPWEMPNAAGKPVDQDKMRAFIAKEMRVELFHKYAEHLQRAKGMSEDEAMRKATEDICSIDLGVVNTSFLRKFRGATISEIFLVKFRHLVWTPEDEARLQSLLGGGA